MKLVVVHANKQPYAMSERLEMLQATGLVEDVIAGSERERFRTLSRSVVPYLVDVNSWTIRVVAYCTRVRRPWIVDTGDDPGTLARNRGNPRWRSASYDLANRMAVRGAVAVVCRGRFHQPLLSRMTRSAVHHAPDTVADTILDTTTSVGDERIVGTFGSVAVPSTGDRAYGWEVIDVVARSGGGLTGIIVANGPGRAILEARARRMGVARDVQVLGGRRMEDLLTTLLPVGFVTSVQSNDLAGWVRTTGKLPLSLGLRKYVVATPVGDAVGSLPREALVKAPDDASLAAAILAIVLRGIPQAWENEAASRAEPFRRSLVAGELASFLKAVSESPGI